MMQRVLMGIGIFAALLVLGWYVRDGWTHAETDDAYISGHLHLVSSRIAETVTHVFVDDNQDVKMGQELVELDNRQYEALNAVASAHLVKAKGDFDRQQPLATAKAISEQDFSTTVQSFEVNQAEDALAKLQLTFTKICAPCDGTIARKNVEVGNRVSTGETLLVLVEPHVWVTANFKETQIAQMKVGQSVEIWVDRIPGHVFKGKVDSFAPGSGNEFALLPADNSTGNFTKVVQRVPVKIEFDPDSINDCRKLLVPGLSVEAKVATGG